MVGMFNSPYNLCQEKNAQAVQFFPVAQCAKHLPIMGRTEKQVGKTPFAKNLRRLRKVKGWTQWHLASKMGWDERDGASYISRLERGKRNAGPDVQERLCEVFGVEQGELFRSESEWGVTRETVRVSGETAPGSYGVPDLSKHRTVEVVAPTREDSRKRLVGQLDKILNHPDHTLVRAIASNLEAFATVAEHTKRLDRLEKENAALKEELDELKLQNKILIEEIAKSRRPDGGPERREAFKTLGPISGRDERGP